MTDRFVRVGSAIREGKTLPPLELYKVKRPRREAAGPAPGTEYYVVDGHHRVAMARKLGQDYLDAHIVEYQVGSAGDAAFSEMTLDMPVAPPQVDGQTADDPPTDRIGPAHDPGASA